MSFHTNVNRIHTAVYNDRIVNITYTDTEGASLFQVPPQSQAVTSEKKILLKRTQTVTKQRARGSKRSKFIPWLIGVLDTGKFSEHGAGWMDRNTGMFSLPWPRQHTLKWTEEDSAMFKDFQQALNPRDRFLQSANYAKLKEKFRAIVRKYCYIGLHHIQTYGGRIIYQFTRGVPEGNDFSKLVDKKVLPEYDSSINVTETEIAHMLLSLKKEPYFSHNQDIKMNGNNDETFDIRKVKQEIEEAENGIRYERTIEDVWQSLKVELPEYMQVDVEPDFVECQPDLNPSLWEPPTPSNDQMSDTPSDTEDYGPDLFKPIYAREHSYCAEYKEEPEVQMNTGLIEDSSGSRNTSEERAKDCSEEVNITRAPLSAVNDQSENSNKSNVESLSTNGDQAARSNKTVTRKRKFKSSKIAPLGLGKISKLNELLAAPELSPVADVAVARRHDQSSVKDDNMDDYIFYCDECPIRFADMDEFSEHTRAHFTEQIRSELTEACDQCQLRFRTKKNLTDHIEAVHVVSTRCPICGYICLGEVNKRRHARMHQVEEEKKMKGNITKPRRVKPLEVCKWCSQKFTKWRKLVAHIAKMHDVNVLTADCPRLTSH